MSKRRIDIGIYAVLVLSIWLAFWFALDCGFINYDDPDYVIDNAVVHEGLTFNGLKWALTTNHAHNWHPLTWISHMLDIELWGAEPAGHHATSILLHSFNACLLFALLFQLTGARWCSAWVALVFAVHPLRVESVVWISERKDTLAVLFALLSSLAYRRYAARPSWRRMLVVALMLVLSLMSKPMAVTLPFLFLLLDYWPLGRIPEASLLRLSIWRQLVVEKLPLFMIVFISSIITMQVQEAALNLHFGLSSRLANAMVSYSHYLRTLFRPLDLAVFYPHPVGGLPASVYWSATALILGLTAAALFSWHRRKYFFVGWFWYIGTLVPMIGIVKVGSQAAADRFTYWPSIGLLIVIAWLAREFVGKVRWRQYTIIGLGAAVSIACIALTRTQVKHWESSESIFLHALSVTPQNQTAHKMLAYHYTTEQQHKKAIAHYQLALRYGPERRIQNNLANTLILVGRTEEAIPHYQAYLAEEPDSAHVHYNLGRAYYNLGRLDDAAASFKHAIAYDPGHFSAHFALGAVYLAREQRAEARKMFEKALKIDPDSADAKAELTALSN